MTVKDLAEGLQIGVAERSAGRTIGEGEFALLTSLTWITTELHSNYEYSKNSQYGERILPGPVVFALMSGLWVGCQRRRLATECGVNFVAALGYDKVRLRKPFLPGDTLWCESTVTSIRPSQSQPGRAILEMHHRGINQREEVVIEFDHQALIERP